METTNSNADCLPEATVVVSFATFGATCSMRETHFQLSAMTSQSKAARTTPGRHAPCHETIAATLAVASSSLALLARNFVSSLQRFLCVSLCKLLPGLCALLARLSRLHVAFVFCDFMGLIAALLRRLYCLRNLRNLSCIKHTFPKTVP